MKNIEEQIVEIKSELDESPQDSDLLNELGVGYHVKGDYKNAVAAFKRALDHSSDAKIHFNLANSLVELQHIQQAVQHYLSAINIKPDYIGALNNLADLYEQTGQSEKASELFEHITKIQPERAMGYFNLGNHFLRSDKTIEAGRCYKKAIEIDPEFYEAYNNIGFILKHVQKYSEAIPYFEKCLEIAPEYEPAIKDLEFCKKQL